MKARSIRFEQLDLGPTAQVTAIDSSNDTELIHRFRSRLLAECPDISVICCEMGAVACDTTFLVGSDVQTLGHQQFNSSTYYVCPGENFHFQIWDRPPTGIDENFWGCRLGIESVNACNASCPMCPVEDLTRKTKVMPMSLSERALEAATRHPEIQTINLYMNGEPLLDRKLDKRISFARQLGLPYLRISTNGHLLSPDQFRALATAGLDEITVSLDAPIASEHERIRPGISFDTIVANIRAIASIKKREGLVRPGLMVGMIAGSDNRHFIPQMCQLVADVFGTTVRVADESGLVFIDDQLGFGMFVSERFDWVGKHKNRPDEEIRGGACPGYKDLIIFPDGRMPLCCLDSNGDNVVGNLSVSELEDIVLGKTRMRMVNALKNRQIDKLPKTCRNCSLLYEDRVNRYSLSD